MSQPSQHGPRYQTENLPGLLRLRCRYCENVNIDDFASYPTNWIKIKAVEQEEGEFWETHRGICPNCKLPEDEEVDSTKDASPPSGEARPVPSNVNSIHPIIKQIIDRDCHVATPAKEVVRHVISKLREGYESLRAMPQADRDKFVEQCVQHHRGNFKEYVEVMSGLTKTVSANPAQLPSSMSGVEIVRLMRKHKVTIEALAFRLGTTQKRVRKIRNTKLDDPLAVRDWIQAITGEDPGPIPEKVSIQSRQEEGDCCFCGSPLYVGDDAYEYVGSLFCSTTCCRQSRGW